MTSDYELPVCKYCEGAIASGKYLPVIHCCACDCYYIHTASYNKHILIAHISKGGRGAPSAQLACADCQEDFYDEKGFNNHLIEHETARNTIQQQGIGSTHHATKPQNKAKKQKIVLCRDCGRDFTSKAAERSHQCPSRYPCISENCLKVFRSLTGLTDHLESGACAGGYSRAKISRILCERDTKSLITVPGALYLLEDHYGAAAEVSDDTESDADSVMDNVSLSSWGVLTPRSGGSGESFEMIANEGVSLDNFDIISLASDDAFSEATPGSLGSSILISEPTNPKQCQICSKTFRTIKDLQQHIESPVHAPKIYHCQLSFILGLEPKKPIKQFKTLGGLVSHIENGTCRGGNMAFDMALGMLGKLAEELGFPATNEAQQKLITIASSKRKCTPIT
ncbi:hypothetical protein TWF481_009875 [Arthrobotrys musiformis]|uniref:C2H2-type domain-containing protein n=1 Tax=Arthrobotrys musiformis TaxID=47236 RepID=A0AAV9W772_9PEZI